MQGKLKIYVDGACLGNPGPGGWGVFVVDGNDAEFEFCGNEEHTTNNRMEMMSAIMALENINPNSTVEIYTDSQYVKNGITLWVKNWIKNNWKTAGKQPVKNQDLWEKLHSLIQQHQVSWHWVKGHSGIFGNERADALARNAIVQFKI